MSIDPWVSAVAAIATCAAAAAAVWGLRYARGLIDIGIKDRQVDRVLAMHKEITTGEIAEARNRFNELMYRAGEEAFGPRMCWRPDWESLIPPNPAVESALSSRRFLGAYPGDMVSGEGHRPIHDLRLVLWSYDRINEARKREASLDEDLLVSLIGHQVVFWRALCGRLDTHGGAHLQALVELASWMEFKKWRDDPRNIHRKTPEESFPCTENNVPQPSISTVISDTKEPSYQTKRLWPSRRHIK